MQELIVIGAGGCMRELIWQIQILNQQNLSWHILGYVDVAPKRGGLFVGNKEYPYLGTDEYLLSLKEDTNVAITLGSPAIRKKIAEKLRKNPYLNFPNLILADTHICQDVRMGMGNIISMGTKISTNVTLGDFTFFNMDTMVCHDGNIGSYTTLSPGVHLAGNVTVGESCDFGMGTRIIQGVTIGNHVITGAGSVVIRDLSLVGTYVGVPVRNTIE